MDTQTLAIAIWRIIGGTFIIFGLATAVVQFGAIATSFGQFMDSESLYAEAVVFGILLWPTVLIGVGLIVIFSSRSLARFVVRGLDESSHG